jgi:hypothetical protein
VLSDSDHISELSFRQLVATAAFFLWVRFVGFIRVRSSKLPRAKLPPSRYNCSLKPKLTWETPLLLKKTQLFSIQLATFILSVGQICMDLRNFAIVLGCFLLMFANVFFVLEGGKDADQGENDDPDDDNKPPFSSAKESLLTIYRMMLGANERGWFTSDLTVLFFFFFSFFVQILLLSMLIAIGKKRRASLLLCCLVLC